MTNATTTTYLDRLESLGACSGALAWCREHHPTDLRAAVGMPAEGEGAVVAKVLSERDAALADNAALREALERLCIDANRMRERPRQGGYDDDLHASVINARAALSSPHPGAGCVVLTREEAARVTAAFKMTTSDPKTLHSLALDAVRDARALLKKGGG